MLDTRTVKGFLLHTEDSGTISIIGKKNKKEELFNMWHSSARNVIERTFGLLKMRWAIIRNPPHYPFVIQVDIILACCYIHNLIRQQMCVDPCEEYLDEYMLRLQ